MAATTKSAKNKRRARIRRIIITVILLAVAGTGTYLYFTKKNQPVAVEEKLSYQVKKETYENVISVSGNISAAQKQELQAAGAGTVEAVYVKEGDHVKKGQVILELDDTDQRYNLSKHDFDIAQKRINGSQREIELMLSQRETLVKKLNDRKVVATFDGIVVKLSVAVGDYLQAQDSVGTIIDRSYMTTSVEVVETDVAKLKIGQKVTFTFPAYSKPVEGYVYAYPNMGTITNRGATVVPVDVRIDNPPDEILPNYSFTGKIEISAPRTVILVENKAIGYTEDGQAFAEIMLPDGSTRSVNVTVEQYDRTHVNVTEGLNGGETLKAQESVGQSGQFTYQAAGSQIEGFGGMGNMGGFGGMGGAAGGAMRALGGGGR